MHECEGNKWCEITTGNCKLAVNELYSFVLSFVLSGNNCSHLYQNFQIFVFDLHNGVARLTFDGSVAGRAKPRNGGRLKIF
jgi:hypothetical protein